MNQAQETFDANLFPANVKETMKLLGNGSSDLWKVPPQNIRVLPGFNVREENDEKRDHVRSLANSIKKGGFWNHRPLAGYAALENGTQVIYVTDGHCRLEAVILAISEGANISTIPVVIAAKGTNRDDLTFELLTTATGKPLTPLEESVAIKRLIRFGHSVNDIADRLSCDVSKIEGRLLFAALPKNVHDLVKSGQVSFTNALATYKKHGTNAEARLTRLAAEAQTRADAAQAVGKKTSNKVMPRHNPGQSLKLALNKNALEMYTTLQSLISDPSFASLDAMLQEQALKLVQMVKNADTDSSSTSTPSASGSNVVSLSRAA